MSKMYRELARQFTAKTMGGKTAVSPVTRSTSKASYGEVIPQGANRGKKSIPDFYLDRLEYFNFDALWSGATVRDKVVKALAGFIRHKVTGLKGVTKLLGTDTVTVNYSYGTLPVAAILSHLLKKDLIIWSENADLSKGNSKIFGQIARHDKVLIIHDLLRETITLKSTLTTLLARANCRIAGVVVLVNTTGKSQLSQLRDIRLRQITYPVPIYSFIAPT